MSQNRGWYGFDLDGTTAYCYWEDGTPYHPLKIGPPIHRTVQRIRKLLDAGEEVRVFTARVGPCGSSAATASGEDLEAIRNAIREWTRIHIGKTLEPTCVKDYSMVLLYDDRARQVTFNEGKIVGENE